METEHLTALDEDILLNNRPSNSLQISLPFAALFVLAPPHLF